MVNRSIFYEVYLNFFLPDNLKIYEVEGGMLKN